MIRRCTHSVSAPNAHRFLRTPFYPPGDTVCIKRGPFQGVKGHVQRDRGNLTFVVTIQLIQRSFAIGVQACDLELAG